MDQEYLRRSQAADSDLHASSPIPNTLILHSTDIAFHIDLGLDRADPDSDKNLVGNVPPSVHSSVMESRDTASCEEPPSVLELLTTEDVVADATGT